MSIKTILLHMANDGQYGARIAVAADLAKRFSAFVEALYVATPVGMPAAVTGRGASYAYIAEATAIAHEKAEKVEREVRKVLQDCPHSWTVVDGDHVELLAARAAFADLAIVSQPRSRTLDDEVPLHAPDRLPLETCCPTLVLPHDYGVGLSLGRHVLVAWKNTREAGRALRNAMPFLQGAERVSLLTPPEENEAARNLMTYLERHGIRPEPAIAPNQAGDVGETILACARDVGADLLVMGAYGHSRLREMVLGGATRSVLENLHLPALLSH